MLPADMLKDVDFTTLLKEKARNTAPSDSEASGSAASASTSEKTHKRTKTPKSKSSSRENRLAKAAAQSVRLVDPSDPDMNPQLEHRVRRQDLPPRQNVDGKHWSEHVAGFAKSWPGICSGGIVLFFVYIGVKQRHLVRAHGFSHALVAEFPALLNIVSVLTNIPASRISRIIAEFDRNSKLPPVPIEPVAPPAAAKEQPIVAVEPEPPVDARRETIQVLVDEAVSYAQAERDENADSGSGKEISNPPVETPAPAFEENPQTAAPKQEQECDDDSSSASETTDGAEDGKQEATAKIPAKRRPAKLVSGKDLTLEPTA